LRLPASLNRLMVNRLRMECQMPRLTVNDR
jgi:hypothetical protein